MLKSQYEKSIPLIKQIIGEKPMILILEDDDLEAMKACSRVWNLALITNRFEKDKDDIVHYLIGPPDYNDIGVAQFFFRKDGDE